MLLLPRPRPHGGLRRHGVLFGLRHAHSSGWVLVVVIVLVAVGIALAARSRR